MALTFFANNFEKKYIYIKINSMKNAKANRRLLTRRIVIENERFHTWPIDTPSGSSITNPLVIKRNPNWRCKQGHRAGNWNKKRARRKKQHPRPFSRVRARVRNRQRAFIQRVIEPRVKRRLKPCLLRSN